MKVGKILSRIAVIVTIALIIFAIWGGDHFVIVISIVYIYILFSIRAGIINKHIDN